MGKRGKARGYMCGERGRGKGERITREGRDGELENFEWEKRAMEGKGKENKGVRRE